MAVHNIPEGGFAVHDKQLTANTVDTVNFSHDPQKVEVLSDGTAEIYVTVDGSDPTVGGASTYKLPARPCVRVISHVSRIKPVKLISSGTPTYSVSRA
jgi:hypothetical protein